MPRQASVAMATHPVLGDRNWKRLRYHPDQRGYSQHAPLIAVIHDRHNTDPFLCRATVLAVPREQAGSHRRQGRSIQERYLPDEGCDRWRTRSAVRSPEVIGSMPSRQADPAEAVDVPPTEWVREPASESASVRQPHGRCDRARSSPGDSDDRKRTTICRRPEAGACPSVWEERRGRMRADDKTGRHHHSVVLHRRA